MDKLINYGKLSIIEAITRWCIIWWCTIVALTILIAVCCLPFYIIYLIFNLSLETWYDYFIVCFICFPLVTGFINYIINKKIKEQDKLWL